jgi:hypothetical protein
MRLQLTFMILFSGFAYGQSLPITLLPSMQSEFLNNRDFTIRHDLKEAYFTAQSPMGELSVITRLSKNLKKASIATFSGKFMDLEPFLTRDGLKLFFASNRPLDATSTESKDFDIWYVQRNNLKSAWSKPINLGATINTESNEFYPSLAENGNLYFTSDRIENSKGKDDIYVSNLLNNIYQNPISLNSNINSDGYEFNAFIASDESYLLFTAYNRPDGLGSGDIYISRKNKYGEWGKALNLCEKVNSDKMDYCPFIDKNDKLYFTSKRSKLEPNKANYIKLNQFLKDINKTENGQSRIYTVDIKEMLKAN